MAGCLTLFGASPIWAAPSQETVLRDAGAAFDQRHYERALELVAPLAEQGMSLPARRLHVKALARLKKPAEALRAYERLEKQTGKPEHPLLREVAFSFIVSDLQDMREQMRGAAYSALKELEADETRSYLEDGLTDGSGLVRALVVEGLGHLKGGLRSEKSVRALDDQAAMVRAAAVKALGRSGDRSVVGAIEDKLKDEQATVRLAAAGALVLLGRADAWPRIQGSAQAPNPEERGAALRVLGALGDRRAVPILNEALRDVQPSIRAVAAAALGELRMREASQSLVALLDDPIPAVRAAAAVGLGEAGSPEGVPGLKKALNDPVPAVRAAAVDGLLRLGVPYRDVAGTVRDLIGHTDPGIRAASAKAVLHSRRNDAEEARTVLVQLLSDPLPRPRVAAARVLGRMGGKPALDALQKALHDSDNAVRSTAGGAIGRILAGDSN
jgi:HEAT repeat protein